MKEIIISAPSKINIGLNIISRREDGYHNIETIFYPIRLHDTLLLQQSDKFELISSNKIISSEKNNTVIKAKELLQKLTGKELNVKITLEKRIPIGGGLGGGSSDGAAALKGLNGFFSLGLNDSQLYEVALKIGADVPFFVDPRPKFASSKGEVFGDIKVDLDIPLLIVNPGIHISTAWAFSKVTPCIPDYGLSNIKELNADTLKELKSCIKNDFEEIVFKEYPQIAEIKGKLKRYGALFSLMTGTGSTLFAFFNNKFDAMKAEMALSGTYFTYLENYLN